MVEVDPSPKFQFQLVTVPPGADEASKNWTAVFEQGGTISVNAAVGI